MNGLENIQFYQALKIKRRGKKKKWVRKVTKSKLFQEKVKVIRMKAEIINQKLVNY